MARILDSYLKWIKHLEMKPSVTVIRDRHRRVAPEACVAAPTGTGYALRDWLQSQGIEPEMITLP